MKAQKLIDECDGPYDTKELQREMRDAETKNRARENSN